MVKQAAWTVGIALVGMGVSAYPANADNILEQMQNEVATVAGKARSCIVSIEDSRAVVVSYNNSGLEKADLENQLEHARIDRAAAAVKAAQEEQRYRAGVITALEVEKPRRELARLDTRLTFLQQKIANFGHESLAAQQKRDVDAHIAELEIDQKSYAEVIKLMQQQVNAGAVTNADLQTAQQQQAHILIDLKAAQAQRKTGTWDTQYAPFVTVARSPATTPKSGSGFSVGGGYIVTTADVAQGMSSPIVTADDGRRIRAMLVAVDSERNVGLVRLSANVTLPALALGDSDKVVPGHFAISIGNQAGQYNSVALGLVSGIRPQGFYSGAHFYPTLLQVDSAVGAGTSGAPILNARGEVIGMIAAALAPEPTPSPSSGYVDTSFQTRNGTAPSFAPLNNSASSVPKNKTFGNNATVGIRTTSSNNAVTQLPEGTAVYWNEKNVMRFSGEGFQTGTVYTQVGNGNKATVFVPDTSVNAPRPLTVSPGTGFAIPINAMKDVIEELKAGKDIVHAWLGVALDDVDNAQEDNGAIRLNPQVRVRGIYADSPASKLQIQPADILVSLNGKPVHTTSEVRAQILPGKAGQKVDVVVQRGARTLTFSLTLETQPTPRPGLLPPGAGTIMQNGPVFQLGGSLSPEKKKTTPKP